MAGNPMNLERLAAGYGDDVKQQVARRKVASGFFEAIFDREQDWIWVRRVLETIDYTQPLMIGPAPPLPKRLAELEAPVLGKGFYTELGRSADAGRITASGLARVGTGSHPAVTAAGQRPGSPTSPGLPVIAPDAAYLKWFAPYSRTARQGEGCAGPGEARYFVPMIRFQESAPR